MKLKTRSISLSILMAVGFAFCFSGYSNVPDNLPPPPGGPPAQGSEPQLLINTGAGEQRYHAGEPAEVNLGAGQSTQVGVDCGQVAIYFLLIFVAEIGDESDSDYALQPSTVILGTAVLIFGICEEMKARGALPMSDQSQLIGAAAVNNGPIIKLTQGAIRVSVTDNIGGANVETENATVSVSGSSDFTVGYSHNTHETVAFSNQGSAQVRPKGSGLHAVTLNAGQEVRVGTSSMSEISPIGSTTSPGNGTSNPPTGNNPPVSSTSGLAQFDTDRNCTLQNTEFFSMIDSWFAGSIDNSLFFAGVDAWLTEANVCTASAATTSKFELKSVRLSTTRNAITFSASGQNIESMGLEVYDLQGQLLNRSEVSGKTLRWNLRDSSGRVVPNGVYLYRVIADSSVNSGQTSELKKLVVMR